MRQRVYLDHNATTPLRPEARDAMLAAMDVLGNPSSVHAEGRAAKGVIERARSQVADLVGCLPQQVIFTSSATEAAALAVAQKARHGGIFAALPTEHDCLLVWSERILRSAYNREGFFDGRGFDDLVSVASMQPSQKVDQVALVAVSGANSETGVIGRAGPLSGNLEINGVMRGGGTFAVICDITQTAGRIAIDGRMSHPAYAILSAHKLGGPKGVGALINFTANDPEPLFKGGGQEMNRRSGTENVIGIAGFGAAAAAAKRDVDAGAWEKVAELRNILESAIAEFSNDTIFVGNRAARLPNTSCMITSGWKGETQVMQMDLAGFAISAGSACSSGKVKASGVLQAMGYSLDEASSAVRVSLGLETTEDDIRAFAQSWGAAYDKHKRRAA